MIKQIFFRFRKNEKFYSISRTDTGLTFLTYIDYNNYILKIQEKQKNNIDAWIKKLLKTD